MAKKKGKKHSPYFWLVSVIIPLVAFIKMLGARQLKKIKKRTDKNFPFDNYNF